MKTVWDDNITSCIIVRLNTVRNAMNPEEVFFSFLFFFVFVFQGADLCCVIVACRERIGWFRFRGKQRKTIFKKNGPKKLIVGKQNNWKWWEKIIMWEQVIVTASLNHRLRVCFRNEWGIKNTRPCGGTWLPLSFTKNIRFTLKRPEISVIFFILN